MLNKKEFVDMLAADHAEMSKKRVEDMVSMVVDGIKRAYEKYGGVRFVDFGTFGVRKCGNRPGKNPRTGEVVWIDRYNAPFFKPGKDLKEIVRTCDC